MRVFPQIKKRRGKARVHYPCHKPKMSTHNLHVIRANHKLLPHQKLSINNRNSTLHFRYYMMNDYQVKTLGGDKYMYGDYCDFILQLKLDELKFSDTFNLNKHLRVGAHCILYMVFGVMLYQLWVLHVSS